MPQEHDQAIDPNLARLAAAYEEAVAHAGADVAAAAAAPSEGARAAPSSLEFSLTRLSASCGTVWLLQAAAGATSTACNSHFHTPCWRQPLPRPALCAGSRHRAPRCQPP